MTESGKQNIGSDLTLGHAFAILIHTNQVHSSSRMCVINHNH